MGEVDREALERMLGLDVPAYVQYGRWIGGILLRGLLSEHPWRITGGRFSGRGEDNR